MASEQNPKKTSSDSSFVRINQLDFLRGVAILLVMGRHSPIYPADTGRLIPIAGAWGRFGWTGVDLFFVLSGFLVGGLLIKEWKFKGSIDIKRFLLRRGFKIWPSYYVFTIYLLIVSLITLDNKAYVLNMWLWNLLHVQNYFGTLRLLTWSLAVEEHFYLLLPFALPLILKNSLVATHRLKIAVLILFLVCFGFRGLHAFLVHPENVESMLTPTHFRIDSLFVGVGLAGIYHLAHEKWVHLSRYRWLFLAIGLVLVSPMIIIRLKMNLAVPVIGFPMLSIGYSLILSALLMSGSKNGFWEKFQKSWISKILCYIGVYSYNIYLWHMDTGYPLARWLLKTSVFAALGKEFSWLVIMPIYIFTSVICGTILGRLIEIPFLKIRDRLFPPRDRGAAGAS